MLKIALPESPVIRNFTIASITVITVVPPLYLWRIFYQATDWAVLLLLPLEIVIYWTIYINLRETYQAKIGIIFLRSSPIRRRLSGRLYSGIVALVISSFYILILAWQSLTAQAIEATSLISLCLLTSLITVLLAGTFKAHLQTPFVILKAFTIGGLIAAVIFIPILAWIRWKFTIYPLDIQDVSIVEAMSYGMTQLPDRRGNVAEILSFFYAIDAAKIWLVMKFSKFNWVIIFYCLDSALVCLILAQAFSTTTAFVLKIVQADSVDE